MVVDERTEVEPQKTGGRERTLCLVRVVDVGGPSSAPIKIGRREEKRKQHGRCGRKLTGWKEGREW